MDSSFGSSVCSAVGIRSVVDMKEPRPPLPLIGCHVEALGVTTGS